MALSRWRFSRRQFVAEGGLLSALASISDRLFSAEAGPAAARPKKSANIYDRLGVRTRINAKGTYTYLTGSLVPPEVVQAMHQAAEHYVYLEELQIAAGKKIAERSGKTKYRVTVRMNDGRMEVVTQSSVYHLHDGSHVIVRHGRARLR